MYNCFKLATTDLYTFLISFTILKVIQKVCTYIGAIWPVLYQTQYLQYSPGISSVKIVYFGIYTCVNFFSLLDFLTQAKQKSKGSQTCTQSPSLYNNYYRTNRRTPIDNNLVLEKVINSYFHIHPF